MYHTRSSLSVIPAGSLAKTSARYEKAKLLHVRNATYHREGHRLANGIVFRKVRPRHRLQAGSCLVRVLELYSQPSRPNALINQFMIAYTFESRASEQSQFEHAHLRAPVSFTKRSVRCRSVKIPQYKYCWGNTRCYALQQVHIYRTGIPNDLHLKTMCDCRGGCCGSFVNVLVYEIQ